MPINDPRFDRHMTEYEAMCEAEEQGKRHVEDCPECETFVDLESCDDYLEALKQ